jgi:hypothetical protein
MKRLRGLYASCTKIANAPAPTGPNETKSSAHAKQLYFLHAAKRRSAASLQMMAPAEDALLAEFLAVPFFDREIVQVSGISSRPLLNGCLGRVLSLQPSRRLGVVLVGPTEPGGISKPVIVSLLPEKLRSLSAVEAEQVQQQTHCRLRNFQTFHGSNVNEMEQDLGADDTFISMIILIDRFILWSSLADARLLQRMDVVLKRLKLEPDHVLPTDPEKPTVGNRWEGYAVPIAGHVGFPSTDWTRFNDYVDWADAKLLAEWLKTNAARNRRQHAENVCTQFTSKVVTITFDISSLDQSFPWCLDYVGVCSAIIGPSLVHITDVMIDLKVKPPSSLLHDVPPAFLARARMDPCKLSAVTSLEQRLVSEIADHAWTLAVVSALEAHDARAVWILSLHVSNVWKVLGKEKDGKANIIWFRILMQISRHLYEQHSESVHATHSSAQSSRFDMTGNRRRDALYFGYQMGEAAEAAGDYDTAIFAYKECVREKMQHSERYSMEELGNFWHSLGLAFKRSRRWDEAATAYKQAVAATFDCNLKQSSQASLCKMYWQMAILGIDKQAAFEAETVDLFQLDEKADDCKSTYGCGIVRKRFGYGRLSAHAQAMRDGDHGMELWGVVEPINDHTRLAYNPSYWVYSFDDDCGVRQLTPQETDNVPARYTSTPKREVVHTYGKTVYHDEHGNVLPWTSDADDSGWFDRMSSNGANEAFAIQRQRHKEGHEIKGLCDGCKASHTRKELTICGGCQTARYCSKQCQRNHWKEHKTTCRRLEHGFVLEEDRRNRPCEPPHV